MARLKPNATFLGAHPTQTPWARWTSPALICCSTGGRPNFDFLAMYGKLGSLKRVVGAHQAGWHGRWWRRAARKKAMDPQYIRNFCIIAHIDHGKSTLADRLLELTGALSHREMQSQVLDSMDLERERGITIKAKSIRLHYTARDGHEYRLNLIDTPGHVDFSYEVSRALSACEGALLVVDASQGVEAQTVANAFLASRHNLTIIPVINKIDLPAARIDYAKEQIENVLAIPADEALPISAKSGLGVDAGVESTTRLG